MTISYFFYNSFNRYSTLQNNHDNQIHFDTYQIYIQLKTDFTFVCQNNLRIEMMKEDR